MPGTVTVDGFTWCVLELARSGAVSELRDERMGWVPKGFDVDGTKDRGGLVGVGVMQLVL